MGHSPYVCIHVNHLMITLQAEPLQVLKVSMIPPRHELKAKKDQRGSARMVPGDMSIISKL